MDDATHGHAGMNPTVHSGAQHTQLLHTGHALLKTKLASRTTRDALITLALSYTHHTQQRHTAEHVLLVRRGHRRRKSAHLIKIWCWRERAGRCRHQQTVQCSQPSAQSTQPAAGTANHQHSTQQTLYTGRATCTLLPPPPCLPAHHLNTKFPLLLSFSWKRHSRSGRWPHTC